jgi:hypothetical protein
VFHQKKETEHAPKEGQRIYPTLLRVVDMISHQGQCQSARKGNSGREGSSEKIDHRQGEHSKDQRNDPEIPFGFWEGVKNVGEDEKERGMKMGRVLPIISQLTSQIVPRFIERMNFIDPEGFFVEGIESEGEADEETKNQNEDLFFFEYLHLNCLN